jgi:DNA-binding response OmpR family regulator
MSNWILVVEGDDTLRELLQDWLRLVFPRHETAGARDSDEAISLAEAQSPRVILVDVGLPDRAGVETIRRLKAAAPSAEIVALATDDHRLAREEAAAAGASATVSRWRIGEDLLPTLGDVLSPEPDWAGERTVVCIEDELEMMELITLILERADFEVIGALSGRQGLDAVREVEPDVVLLDLMMPDMDGWEVYRRMKADNETKDIPIIVVSVVPRTSARVHGLEVDDYVIKPFVPEDLVRRISTALRVVA